ncbi:Glutathione synthase/RimK-type ligase, ATP-grasp superfamily [Sinosporangium album]|uniref:Glutathione synthase/RimK-type ligase, ATP-grasp superfamily n=1 Tax=Sinosporangium album TaxID=504805 RepID=A0A1G7QUK8_9ACTN|nr:peptide ligase PGM1-related protein [Sinosporangium album]SDG02192.1 Glutathione synthase/RimK-type ligase, ATP-grasp superfamily [Sinosporangium album]
MTTRPGRPSRPGRPGRTSRTSRAILANIVNDIMVEAPTEAYRRAMAAVTPRKLWQAHPGDCVVMLAPCSAVFRDYVASVIDLDVDRVEIVAPPEVRGAHALEVAADLGALDRVAEREELLPFVLDAPVLEFARRRGVRLLPYGDPPDDAVVAALRLINTKRGFREVAAGLGLPVADGGHAATVAELAERIGGFLGTREAVIIKTNRASNGFGNAVIRRDAERTIEEQVHDAVAGQPLRGCGWVFEEFLPFTATPSMEMLVEDGGVTEFYTCDQRTVNNAWTGMVTPAREGPRHHALVVAAHAVGGWLRERGYRGIYDVDCGVHDGGYVVTEANVRRTGGTYLEELARRLRSGDSPVRWRADVRHGAAGLDFAGAVAKLGAEGLSDPAAPARAVLTADTLDVDGKWRYLVVGCDDDAVADAESRLERILGIGIA